MARLIIHAGTGKTGTSAVQASLLKNRDALLAQGIRYLQSNQPKPEVAAKHQFRWNKREAPGWDALRREAAELARTDDTVVISNETLWKKDEEELEFFLSFFPGFEFTILLYVREQVEFLESRALQAVKQRQKRREMSLGESGGMEDFLAEFVPELDYLEVARRWEKVFGEGTFLGRLYSRDAFPNGNIIDDFYEAIGASPETLDLQAEMNPSLSAPFAMLLKNREKYLRPEHREAELFEAAMRLSKVITPNPRKLLTIDQAEEIRERFAASNEAFFERYVVNGEGFRIREHAPGEEYDLRDLAASVEELIDGWPLVTVDSFGPRKMTTKVFRSGWRTGSDPEVFEVKQDSGEASLRFRIPLRAMLRIEGDSFRLEFACREESVVRDVRVNAGEPVRLDLAREPIAFSRGLLGPSDSVEIRLSVPDHGNPDMTITGYRVTGSPEAPGR